MPARVAAVAAALRASGAPGADAAADDRELLLWYLRDRRMDVDEAVAKLQKLLAWRSGSEEWTSVSEVAVDAERATGKVELVDGGRTTDVLGRPVLLVRVAKHVIAERDLVASRALSAREIQATVDAIPPGSGVEQFLGIFDMRGFSAAGGKSNADFAFVKFMVKLLFDYFPRRVGRVLLVGAPMGFGPVWAIVKPWLGSYGELVRFAKPDEVREYFAAQEDVPTEFR